MGSVIAFNVTRSEITSADENAADTPARRQYCLPQQQKQRRRRTRNVLLMRCRSNQCRRRRQLAIKLPRRRCTAARHSSPALPPLRCGRLPSCLGLVLTFVQPGFADTADKNSIRSRCDIPAAAAAAACCLASISERLIHK